MAPATKAPAKKKAAPVSKKAAKKRARRHARKSPAVLASRTTASTNSAGPALQWAIIARRSAHLTKLRCGGGGRKSRLNFNSDPRNLTNRNTFRSSGLVQNKALGVEKLEANKNPAGLALVVKRNHAGSQIRSTRIELKKNPRNTRRALEKVRSLVKKECRRDLMWPAVRRASALLRMHVNRAKKTAQDAGRTAKADKK